MTQVWASPTLVQTDASVLIVVSASREPITLQVTNNISAGRVGTRSAHGRMRIVDAPRLFSVLLVPLRDGG
jgi:hypothetical protein